MEVPNEAAVMTLPGVTLFPQALMPLYIFEPRYRRMLAESLHSHRMFVVAMQRQGVARECPSVVAGLGLVRLCVDHPDGTSHLILQGMSRVELTQTLHYKPFRISRFKMLQAPAQDNVTIDALVAKVRDLATERVRLGVKTSVAAPNAQAIREMITSLEKMNDPDQVADAVSSALLTGPEERQTIMETIEIEPRLKHLIHFLMAEIRQRRKNKAT